MGQRQAGSMDRQGSRATTQQRRQGAATQQGRQGERTQRSGDRQDTRGDRQGERTQRSGDRQDTQGDRQSERTDRGDKRQEERTERADRRQDGLTERQDARQDFYEDNHWGWGWGHHYHHPYAAGAIWAGLVIGAAIVVVTALGSLAIGGVKYARDLERERRRAVIARDDAEELLEFMLQDLHGGLEAIGRVDLLEQMAQKSLAYYDSLDDESLHGETAYE